MIDIKKYVLDHVTRIGACGYGLDETISAENVQEFINLLKTPKGTEHCMEFGWPSMEILKEFEEPLKENGIYVSGHHVLVNPQLVIAFGGVINISIDGFNVCEVYATNEATINIFSKDHAYSAVELHKNSTLEINNHVGSIIKEFRK